VRDLRHAVTLGIALALGGCCCGPAVTPGRQASGGVDRTGRLFVVIRATPLEAGEDGRRQVLVEARVLSVRGGASIPALEGAERLDVAGAPAWLAGTQVPDAGFGAGVQVEQQPSVVTFEEEEATIQVGESSGDGGTASLTDVHVASTYDAEGLLTLALRFEQRDHGRLTHAVPLTHLSGPAGRAFIVEALPPR